MTMKKSITSKVPMRVDLLGGTLDLYPFYFLMPKARTLNIPLVLGQELQLVSCEEPLLKITSSGLSDSITLTKEHFFKHSSSDHPYSLILNILKLFPLFKDHHEKSGIEINITSDIPAGSGLGGSSALACALFALMNDWFDDFYNLNQMNQQERYHAIVKAARNQEATILGQGIPGLQDYYPALYKEALCMKASVFDFEVEALGSEFTQSFKSKLSDHALLIHSGVQRGSGLHNWSIYKSYFDGDLQVRKALHEIADLSFEAEAHFKTQNIEALIELMKKEGHARSKLSSGLVPLEVQTLVSRLADKTVGVKMCGAGGGGSFLLLCPKNMQSQAKEYAKTLGMSILDLES